MNTPLDLMFWAVRDTKKGSDMYGSCEVCKHDTSRVYFAEKQRVWRHSDGHHYLSPVGGGTYGHMDCLISAHGKLWDMEQFKRDGKSARLVSDDQLTVLTRALIGKEST